MPPPTKISKLLFARERLLSDLKHVISSIKTFNAETSRMLVVCKARALETHWREFRQNLSEIEMSADSVENQTAYFVQNQSMEDEHIKAKIKIAEILNLSTNDESFSDASFIFQNEEPKKEFKKSYSSHLPEIKVAPFSGNYDDWNRFSQLFTKLVSREDLDSIDRIYYLQQSLKGEPAQLIKHLPLDENSFEVAWKLLKEQYEVRRHIVDAQFQLFFSIKKIQNENSEELRSMLRILLECESAFKSLKMETDSMGSMMVYYCAAQMDPETARNWELELRDETNEPKLTRLISFLQTRCRLLSQIEKNAQFHSIAPAAKSSSRNSNNSNNNNNNNKQKSSKAFFTQAKQEKRIKCYVCSEGHRTFECPNLINAPVEERKKIILEKQLCTNCLFNHKLEECHSKYVCIKCKQKHNSLLHVDDDSEAASSTTFSAFTRESRETLLATAIIPVYHENGDKTFVRALIDQGSTSNFISEKLCQRISARRYKLNTTVTSLNDSETGRITAFTNLTVGSLYDKNYRLTFDALILNRIASVDTSKKINSAQWTHILDLELADPKYFEPGDIDVLIGARVYAEIILSGLRKGKVNTPIAQLTKFGWVLSGSCDERNDESRIMCNFTTLEENVLSRQLQQFFELEEVHRKFPIQNEDAICEQEFMNGLTRAADGKFMVKLPFKIDPNSPNFLGDSYKSALIRLFQVEKRLAKDPTLYEMYQSVLQEYIDLGHMREATLEEAKDLKHAYFMPHHAVVKMNRTSTKVRVVFDASNKSSNGKSLNDNLMVGPTIQPDLFTNLTRWRKHLIAYTADIEKMYRQVWIIPDHTKYLRILWRSEINGPIKQYIMLTVTFGTASAPYQAIRALHQVGNEIEVKQPEIAQAIKTNFYVDDFLGCKETVEEAVSEQRSISDALNKYGFRLCKWKSNSSEFQKHIPETQQENVLEFSDSTCKALGILWQPKDDTFTFRLTLEEVKLPLTKRKLVSDIAKLFDPLGWLSPSIILAKLLIQQLWIEEYGWDESLPTKIQEYWLTMREYLFECDQIKIDRWIGLSKSVKSQSLIGFADSSESAYAAVVYMRTEYDDGTVRITLVAAKTKVAPMQRITIPKLELCAALLLTRLLKKVIDALEIDDLIVHAFSDNKTVLAWLKEIPIKWQTFVANRVSEIQETFPNTEWKYVITHLNPADCATRGMMANDLKNHDLWWHGPEFIKLPLDQWPTFEAPAIPAEEIPERRKIRKIVKTFFTHEENQNDFLLRYQNLTRLLRITSYCLRWKKYKRSMSKSSQNALLSVEELDQSLKCWVRYTQRQHFPDEWNKLIKNQPIKASSPILSLTPNFDKEEKLIRSRGRLKHSNLPEGIKFPIILPDKGFLTWLIIDDAHRRTLHGGCQLTLNFIRQRFWMLHSRAAVSNQIKKCVRCFRYKMETRVQLMGNLPSYRVQMSHPFQYTGIDFAGYFEVKTSRRRNAPFTKCYVALFVCMSTKAIHLELVRDLSTEAFLDAFRCFCARRGLPSEIFTDRGTNFIGAHNEMPRLLSDLANQSAQVIVNDLLNDQIKWHFNPAHSPHFGGLWEAGVKSMKTHLKRVLHKTRMTEHQFHTTLSQIEACLNSRPLCKLNEDPEDLEVLTPGHFLIGRPLKTLPEPNYLPICQDRIKSYLHSQRLVQDFWKRWHFEYLDNLLGRPRWTRESNNVAVNQIVLLKDDNLPPSRWLIGRVCDVTQGSDGLVRAVQVKCNNTIVTRAIHKLCLLPTEDNQSLFKPTLKPGQHVGTDHSSNQNE